jgi:hypothetical protein
MGTNCVVCGREIEQGIACELCDSPSSRKEPAAVRREAPSGLAKTATDVLRAARVPHLILTGEKTVGAISQDVRKLLGLEPDEKPVSLRRLESRLGAKLPPMGEPFSTRLTFGDRDVDLTMVPLAGGLEGSALIFHRLAARGNGDRRGAGEPVLAQLRALREALTAAKTHRASDPLLEDTAATLDRIVSELDAPPEPEDWTNTRPHKLPGSVPQVVRQAAARFMPIAELKQIQLHVDLAEIKDVVRDAGDLEEALVILLENAIHYVPHGGQIFIGARTAEQKGRQVALFFVMDNGPAVPEELRKEIFTPGFQWDSSRAERTGRNLAFCHSFAVRRGGQCWVDVKPGKTCTFFLSIRVV